MIPDPVTLDLAERTPFPYATVHEALTLLAASGVDPETAEALVIDAAQANVHPVSLANVYLTTRAGEPWSPAVPLGTAEADLLDVAAAIHRLRDAVLTETARALARPLTALARLVERVRR